ncbi:hypothetical protein MLD52_17695 [Puniceicoccaceae bacterium K14]|nr:hypothetical protein [Puniceicoccaceae bacterium K14]
MEEIDLVKLAEQIATEAHLGQFRRGGVIPYIEHPASVSNRVGNDPKARVVAWLHDVIEDSEIDAEELKKRGIPDDCVEAVVLLTKTDATAYDEYLEKIASSPLATMVKIADMISNLADNPSVKQLKKYSKGLVRLTQDL